jgi:hypothetical protein
VNLQSNHGCILPVSLSWRGLSHVRDASSPRCSRRRSAGGAEETHRNRADCPRQPFRRIRRRRRLPGEHRSERSDTAELALRR